MIIFDKEVNVKRHIYISHLYFVYLSYEPTTSATPILVGVDQSATESWLIDVNINIVN